jgi:hypothetical protein
VKQDRPYLKHILDAIDRIRDYTHQGQQAFMEDPKTQDAVIRKLETQQAIVGSIRWIMGVASGKRVGDVQPINAALIEGHAPEFREG